MVNSKGKENCAYKYRLYPNEEQIVLINKTFGCSRFIYNNLLADKQEYYKVHKKTLKKEVSEYKKAYAFLSEIDSLALANAKRNLETAYKNFFKKKSGFPTFHKKGKHDNYTTNNVNNNIEIVRGFIKLPKLGFVKIKQHRAIGHGETIKSCTISRVADKYYISVLTEREPVPITPKDVTTISDDKVLGIDFSVPHFYVDSNGNSANYPKFYRTAQKQLAKEQRRLSRKVYKSKNYYKQLQKVQKLQAHIANQRKNFAHQLSRQLANQYDVICFEDLNLSALKKALHFGKPVSDAGFGMFRNFVQYKMERDDKYCVFIDKWYPSTKTCSHCGYKNDDITLKTTEWTCPHCGTHHLRDHNAAINIKREGWRMLAAS